MIWQRERDTEEVNLCISFLTQKYLENHGEVE